MMYDQITNHLNSADPLIGYLMKFPHIFISYIYNQAYIFSVISPDTHTEAGWDVRPIFSDPNNPFNQREGGCRVSTGRIGI